METKSNKDVFMTVFFLLLVTAALVGLASKTAQHELSYEQVQWLAGIGIVFMIVFALSIIDDQIGFTSFVLSIFGLNKKTDMKIDKKTVDDLNKTIDKRDDTIGKQDETITGYSQRLQSKTNKVEELESICEAHQMDKNEYKKTLEEQNKSLQEQTKEINQLKKEINSTNLNSKDNNIQQF